jgi:hypothetical protein
MEKKMFRNAQEGDCCTHSGTLNPGVLWPVLNVESTRQTSSIGRQTATLALAEALLLLGSCYGAPG